MDSSVLRVYDCLFVLRGC